MNYNEKNNNNGSSGIGFFGILGIVFIVLKLCHIINWSWFWVLCPLWIGFAIILVLIIFLVIASIINSLKRRK